MSDPDPNDPYMIIISACIFLTMLSFAAVVYTYKKMHKLDTEFKNERADLEIKILDKLSERYNKMYTKIQKENTNLESQINKLSVVCCHLNNEQNLLYRHSYNQDNKLSTIIDNMIGIV